MDFCELIHNSITKMTDIKHKIGPELREAAEYFRDTDNPLADIAEIICQVDENARSAWRDSEGHNNCHP